MPRFVRAIPTEAAGRVAAAIRSAPVAAWSPSGLLAVELAETHPGEFNGIVTLNGMVGGTKAQRDYVGNVRLLFDLLYQSPLGGSVLDLPQQYDLNLDVILPVVIAGQTDPTGLGIIARLRQTPLPGASPEQLVQSLVTAVAFNFRGIHDVLDRTNGACPIDNADAVYEAVLPGLLPQNVLDMLNAMAPRFDRSLPTDLLFDRQYEPSGSLAIPMVAVHDRHDHTVPLLHELMYQARVEAAGFAANRELRIVERYAHTDFPADETAAEAVAAVTDLRTRVLGAGI